LSNQQGIFPPNPIAATHFGIPAYLPRYENNSGLTPIISCRLFLARAVIDFWPIFPVDRSGLVNQVLNKLRWQ